MNTEWVRGIVVYAGTDTKLFLNQQPPPSKFSTVERLLNKFIYGIFAFQMLVCLINAILSGFWEDKYASKMWYLGDNDLDTPVYALRNFFTYFVLFNTMIPISLWVTLELVKVGQAKFMEYDEEMSVSKQLNVQKEKDITETHMSAKTSNLNEDLGRIQHIFSDKTGTLTENIMTFNKASIRGVVFDEKVKPGGIAEGVINQKLTEPEATQVKNFLLVMTICNTTMISLNQHGELVYKSQSPDETALVATARENDVILTRRTDDKVVVEVFGKETEYTVLATLDFTSSRRRMSVIVRTPDHRIILLCKGADIVIYERLVEGDNEIKDLVQGL
jgi:magnesium-transporting ATPase (P-type)